MMDIRKRKAAALKKEAEQMPNKYIKNDSVSYDSKVDITEEYNARSKELATEGIDLVSKGTIDRSKAERMLKEGKALKDIAKKLAEKGNTSLSLGKNHREKGNADKAEADSLQRRIDQLQKEINKLLKEHDAIWSAGQKNIDRSEILHHEGTDQTDRSVDTLRRAENMLEESEKLYILGQKEIDKGNKLIDKSKETSNEPKKDIGDYVEEHFTGEIELDTKAMSQLAEEEIAEEEIAEEDTTKNG